MEGKGGKDSHKGFFKAHHLPGGEPQAPWAKPLNYRLLSKLRGPLFPAPGKGGKRSGGQCVNGPKWGASAHHSAESWSTPSFWFALPNSRASSPWWGKASGLFLHASAYTPKPGCLVRSCVSSSNVMALITLLMPGTQVVRLRGR